MDLRGLLVVLCITWCVLTPEARFSYKVHHLFKAEVKRLSVSDVAACSYMCEWFFGHFLWHWSAVSHHRKSQIAKKKKKIKEETRDVEEWCNYSKRSPSAGAQNTRDLPVNELIKKWWNCHQIVHVILYFSWRFMFVSKATSQRTIFFFQTEAWHFITVALVFTPVCTHPFPPFERPLLKQSVNRQWRSCWKDALSLLIQPSVGAQSSIHSFHILILSLALAPGSPL